MPRLATRFKRTIDGVYFCQKDRYNSHELSSAGCCSVIVIGVLVVYAIATGLIAGPILLAESMNGVWKSDCVLVDCETPRQGVYHAIDFNMTETINGYPCDVSQLGKKVVCYAGPNKGISLFHRKGFALSLALLIPSVVIVFVFATWGVYLLIRLCIADVRAQDKTLDPPKPKSNKTDSIVATSHGKADYQSLDDSC